MKKLFFEDLQLALSYAAFNGYDSIAVDATMQIFAFKGEIPVIKEVSFRAGKVMGWDQPFESNSEHNECALIGFYTGREPWDNTLMTCVN